MQQVNPPPNTSSASALTSNLSNVSPLHIYIVSAPFRAQQDITSARHQVRARYEASSHATHVSLCTVGGAITTNTSQVEAYVGSDEMANACNA